MSETKPNIYQALLAAKSQMNPPVKDATNPHFRSKYATLGAVMAAAVPALHEAGIVVEEKTEMFNDGHSAFLKMTLVLAWDPKQRVESEWPLEPEKKTPQGYGSALTYGRRYLLQTMCGLAAEDDDGNAGSGRGRKPQNRPAPKPEPAKPKPLPDPMPDYEPPPAHTASEPPPAPAVPPSASREAVNKNLWRQLWNNAEKAGMAKNELWEAVWVVRPELKPKGKITQKRAETIILQLRETDFTKLFHGVSVMLEREPGGDDREGE